MSERAVVPVVILATQPGLLMHSALGIARSLGQWGVPCHFVHRSRRSAVSASRYIAATHQVTYDERQPRALVQELVRLADRLGDRPVLIPVDDPGALFLAANAGALTEAFRFPAQDHALSQALSDKAQLHELAQKHGVPSPRAVVIDSLEGATAFAESAGFPLVVKVIDPLMLYAQVDARVPSVTIVKTAEELARSVADCPGRLLLQEFLPGDAESVWIFNGYFDAQSVCRQGFTGHKIRQFRPETGSTALGVCRANPVVERLARDFLQQVGYRGIVDMGFRYDARDRSYKLLDVNPRLGATFRLFVGQDGGDVVRTMYADVTGGEITPSALREGRRWVAEPYDVLTASHSHRAGSLALRDWVRSYRGVEEAAWWDRHDPKPFVAMIGCSALTGLNRLRTRSRGETSAAVTEHFDNQVGFWDGIYRRDDIEGLVYRSRQARVLELLEQVGLGPESLVLDVGAGAGLLTASLARRGSSVTAIDVSAKMVERTRGRTRALGLADRVTVRTASVSDLPFPSNTYEAVVALGVVPWLPHVELGLREMARVLRPGGYLVLSADNRRRLTWRLDPRHAPALRPVRRAVRRGLVSAGWRAAPVSTVDAQPHTPGELDEMVREAGLVPVSGGTVGFGPFTLLGRPALNRSAGLRVHARLQSLADRGTPGFRSWGNHYVLLCQRPV